ncbi:hypothetical protein [Aneurinibacillus tyrosinisolvens]|uniref:hypothetical protein n=1 Tax=Aneurinibacillus tyrosinisolvens TaxID=1443435 RepID=UPI00063F43C7|nr:hypothetical protein [Aneurinibacillus tyrosinisolvens]
MKPIGRPKKHRGNGDWQDKKDNRITSFQEKDFIILRADSATEALLQADKAYEVRMILIEVPTETNYPLYPRT